MRIDYIGGKKTAEIIKTYRQPVPAMKFIGKKYTNSDAWGERFGKGRFYVIEKAAGGEAAVFQVYEDGDANIGLMCLDKAFNTREYRIGMFVPPDTKNTRRL